MTNKYKYFVANWKMFGDLKTINSINKVIKISRLAKFNKSKIIYCPPYTLLNNFVQKLKKTKIDVGAQNCHQEDSNGSFTGSISSKMIKSLGCNYVILGHSENRNEGDNDAIINNLYVFKQFGCKVLLGVSRKSFLSINGDGPASRLPATLGATVLAIQKGVDILRVHDIHETKSMISIIDRIKN